jgi:hypothetical protein
MGTRDEVARTAVHKLIEKFEQLIQLSGNHLHLVAMKPELDQIKRSLYEDGGGSRLPTLPPAAPTEPIPNAAPFYGCAKCSRSVEELIGQGHAPDCDAIRNPTIVQV